MKRREFVKKLARTSLAAGLASAIAGTVGCGTLMYRDRIGQQHSRDIDWQVAALNGLGLAFFFVPGAIAFAVDFYTGAIYLPPEYPQAYPPEMEPEMMTNQYPPAQAPQQNPGGYSPAVQPASASFPQPTQQVPLEGATPQSAQPLWNQSGQLNKTYRNDLTLRRIRPVSLSPADIEAAISSATGQSIKLLDPTTRVSRISSLYHFADQKSRHESDAGFGQSLAEAFRQG